MYIFISHSSLDKPFVRQLADSLAYYGVPLFLDEREIKVGDNIPNKIYSALENATHLVYVLSKNSINSNWVKEEFIIAKKKQLDQKGCLILPVRVQDIVNSFGHEFYLVEGSRHRELYQAVAWCVNSGLGRATVSEIS